MLRAFLAWRKLRRRAPERDMPTPEDLPELERGVANAALAFLLAECAAGRLRCYTYLAYDQSWRWWVADETRVDTATPREYRRDISDWAAEWLASREGGAR